MPNKDLTKKELRQQIAELQEYVTTLEKEGTRQRGVIDREHKRSAAANNRNAVLLKKVRELDWEKRTLETKIEADVYHARRAEVLSKRLRLIRDVSSASLDDWVERSADKSVAELTRSN